MAMREFVKELADLMQKHEVELQIKRSNPFDCDHLISFRGPDGKFSARIHTYSDRILDAEDVLCLLMPSKG